ncbi:MAG: hypothetical protein ACYTBV_15865 [Planctomycetota bacterium]
MLRWVVYAGGKAGHTGSGVGLWCTGQVPCVRDIRRSQEHGAPDLQATPAISMVETEMTPFLQVFYAAPETVRGMLYVSI